MYAQDVHDNTSVKETKKKNFELLVGYTKGSF